MTVDYTMCGQSMWCILVLEVYQARDVLVKPYCLATQHVCIPEHLDWHAKPF